MKIEHNVPIPARKSGQSKYLHLLLNMKKGDSILLDDVNKGKNVAKYTYINSIARKNKIKTTSRRIDNTIRMWKLSN